MNNTAKIIILLTILIGSSVGSFLLHKKLIRESILSSYEMGCVNGITAALEPPVKSEKEYDFIVKICAKSALAYLEYKENK